MLGFIYLMLILGWILIVLFLRCKKSIAPHFAFTDNYTENVGKFKQYQFINKQFKETQPNIPKILWISLFCTYTKINILAARQPTVHVIELPSEDFRDDMDSYSQVSRSRLDSYRSRSVIDERTIETYPTDAVINPAYTNDEEYILNGR